MKILFLLYFVITFPFKEPDQGDIRNCPYCINHLILEDSSSYQKVKLVFYNNASVVLPMNYTLAKD